MKEQLMKMASDIEGANIYASQAIESLYKKAVELEKLGKKADASNLDQIAKLSLDMMKQQAAVRELIKTSLVGDWMDRITGRKRNKTPKYKDPGPSYNPQTVRNPDSLGTQDSEGNFVPPKPYGDASYESPIHGKGDSSNSITGVEDLLDVVQKMQTVFTSYKQTAKELKSSLDRAVNNNVVTDLWRDAFLKKMMKLNTKSLADMEQMAKSEISGELTNREQRGGPGESGIRGFDKGDQSALNEEIASVEKFKNDRDVQELLSKFPGEEDAKLQAAMRGTETAQPMKIKGLIMNKLQNMVDKKEQQGGRDVNINDNRASAKAAKTLGGLLKTASLDKTLYKQAADSFKDLRLYKQAQYVGLQGYWIKNTRCWGNCYRQKRAKSPDLSAQEVWTECQSEYVKSINKDDADWNKYANEDASVIKTASKKLQSMYENEDIRFRTAMRKKIRSGDSIPVAVFTTIEENQEKIDSQRLDVANKFSKLAANLEKAGMKKEATLAKELSVDLIKSSGLLDGGLGKIKNFIQGVFSDDGYVNEIVRRLNNIVQKGTNLANKLSGPMGAMNSNADDAASRNPQSADDNAFFAKQDAQAAQAAASARGNIKVAVEVNPIQLEIEDYMKNVNAVGQYLNRMSPTIAASNLPNARQASQILERANRAIMAFNEAYQTFKMGGGKDTLTLFKALQAVVAGANNAIQALNNVQDSFSQQQGSGDMPVGGGGNAIQNINPNIIKQMQGSLNQLLNANKDNWTPDHLTALYYVLGQQLGK